MGVEGNINEPIKSRTSRYVIVGLLLIIVIIVVYGIINGWNISSPIVSVTKPDSNPSLHREAKSIPVEQDSTKKFGNIDEAKQQVYKTKKAIEERSSNTRENNNAKNQISNSTINSPTIVGDNGVINVNSQKQRHLTEFKLSEIKLKNPDKEAEIVIMFSNDQTECRNLADEINSTLLSNGYKVVTPGTWMAAPCRDSITIRSGSIWI